MKKMAVIPMILLAFLLVLSLSACADNASELNTVKTIRGTITDTGKNSLSIETDDGQVYTFSTVGANTSEAPNLAPGIEVEIYYTGIIDGTDTSNTVVTRIVQSGTASSGRVSGGGAEHSVAVTILGSDGAALSVCSNRQDTLTFNLVGADATDANGLVIDDPVTMYCTETNHSDDTSNITVA